MLVRSAKESDQKKVLELLDKFRADCIEQITGEHSGSTSARTGGKNIYEELLNRSDYCILLLISDQEEIVGILTGYTCPMLRSGRLRAEVEEFFVNRDYRGQGNAQLLMDAFFDWCRKHVVEKVNLESDNGLQRAHSFCKKYGFEMSAKRFVKKL